MTRRRTAVAILVLALTAAACGGSSHVAIKVDGTPSGLRHAAEVTLGKGTAKIDMTMKMTIEGHDVSMTGSGAMDPAKKRFALAFDMSSLFSSLLSSSSAPPGMSSLFTEPMREVLDGTVMYIRFPFLSALTGGNSKPWLKLDLAKVNKSFGDLLGSGGGAFGSDPSSFLRFLEGAGRVTKVGDETVRGVATTHFSGTYTFNDSIAALPADQRSKLEDAFKGLGISDAAKNQPIPFDVWVGNSDGLIRKMAMTMDMSKLAPANAKVALGTMAFTVEYYDFGAPVDIAIPPPSQVQDYSAQNSQLSDFSSVGSTVSG